MTEYIVSTCAKDC